MKIRKRWSCWLLLSAFAFAGKGQELSLVNLRCEARKDPLGIGASVPRLSWELVSGQRNTTQSAYRILVADDTVLLKNNKGNVWDSRKISSSASIQVPYRGKALLSAQTYYWKLMVWDNKGRQSAWSSTSYWQMGLLQKADWKNASWIGYDEIADSSIIAPHMHLNGKKAWGARRNTLPMLRKSFTTTKSINRATAFVCGLGHFEMTVNGTKTGDHFLDPGWTNYSKHALYVTFDLTQQLRLGENAIGIMLGNGFYYIPGQRYRKMTGAYGLPKLIFRLLIEYEDDSVQNIISDSSWKTASSPIIFSSIYGGEDYDAGLEQKNWNQPGFDDRGWKPVILTEGPQVLESQSAEPVRIMQRFDAKGITQVKQNKWVFDLGQNFSGIPALMTRGHKGDTIKIIPAELINEDGTANQRGSGGPSYFTYILKGGETETWRPMFTYYGFRFLEVHCIPGDSLRPAPEIIKIEGLHIRNAAVATGSFTCSNELFNKTWSLIDWAIKSNTISVFTDCPHREKLGWLEETHLMGSSVQYNYDIAALCKKVIRDMIAAQYPDGKIPEIAPEFTQFTPPFDESPEWGSASIILPWYLYQWYGDRQSLELSYPMMKNYIRYLKSRAKDNILSHGLGDWYDIGPNRPGFAQMTPMGITATATYYYDLVIISKVAGLFGRKEDEVEYRRLAIEVKKSFNRQFFDRTTKQYGNGSQTSNAMALYMGLVDPADKNAVVANLVKDIQNRNNALTAGDVGYRYVLRALEDAGRHDVIYEMNNRDDVPGYGYQLKHGATALTESWQASPSVSNNHFMLGHLMEWFYQGLAGIQQAANAVGFKEIIIKPALVGGISHTRASFHSPYGQIRSDWEKNGNGFSIKLEIPANTSATLYLPARPSSVLKERGKAVRKGKYDNGTMILKIGSGRYHFTIDDK